MARSTLDKKAKKAIKDEIEADPRNISTIWNAAINEYNKTAREQEETADGVLITPTRRDAKALKEFGMAEMQRFTKFRHDQKKVDKVRTLFMKNIDLIDIGSKQLLNAVSTSFPPAAAIGTVMTFVLSAFKSVSADYDVVANFFEDMNNFLQRVTIIAERVPEKEAYRTALIDVFIAMLSLCAAARQYIVLGRFKKWMTNAVYGDDSALKGGRQQMDTSLARLQSATELAILDNTENILEQQAEMGSKLSKFLRELDRNAELQEQIAADQEAAMQKIGNDVQTMMRDLKQLLSFHQEAKSGKTQGATKVEEVSGNVVRHFYDSWRETRCTSEKVAEPYPDMLAVLANLEKSQVEETGSWLFEHPTWLAWTDWSQNCPTLLWVEGDSGMGKTHLSLAIYNQLREIREPEQEVCTVYFSCRGTDMQRNNTRDLLRNCAIQIVDQSHTIRQGIEAKWRNFQIHADIFMSGCEALDSRSVDNDVFIYNNFSKESKRQLFVVVDGIDQFSKKEIVDFLTVIYTAQVRQLRVKFLATVRLIDAFTPKELNMVQAVAIHIGRDEVLPDLRRILWNGINSEDSAYDGLRNLSKHRKQQVAQRIIKNADNFLYVDQTLRFVASTVREGNIENLLDSLPTNLTELYEAILKRSLQSFAPDTIRVLKIIITWLTFSLRPLTLEQLSSLAESTGLSSEQVLSFLLHFFELDFMSKDTATLLSIDFTELFDNVTDVSKENLSSDDTLRVQAKSRAAEDFLGSAGSMHALRTKGASDAHRLLFLSAAEVILQSKVGTEVLQEYATEHILNHWTKTVPEEYDEDEQIQVCRTFRLLLNDDRYAEGLATNPRVNRKEDILPFELNPVLFIWFRHAQKLNMLVEETDYWKTPKNALDPLVKGLVRCWKKSSDDRTALKAWTLARDISRINDASELIGVLGEPNGQAHFAIGLVLALPEPYQPYRAIQRLDTALNTSQDVALRRRCYIQMATVCLLTARWTDTSVEGGRLADGIEYCRLILEGEESLQLSTRADVLRIRGSLLMYFRRNVEAAESFGDARRLSGGTGPVQQLFDELLCLSEDPLQMTDRLLSFSPIDQIRFVTSVPEVGEPGHTVNIPTERMLLPAFAKSHRGMDITRMYREIINALDAEQSAPPIKVDLARILFRVRNIIEPQGHEKTPNDAILRAGPGYTEASPWRGDESSTSSTMTAVKEAKLLLNQVLDSVSGGGTYKLTGRKPLDVAKSALLLMMDILLEEFRSSKKIEDKVQILLQAKELPHRKFLTSQPLITDEIWNQFNTAVAHMLKKIGPMSEYEQVMTNIFETAIAGLRDDSSFNDQYYTTAISRIFMLEPSLHKFGEMMRFVEWDEGIYPCDGICLPVIVYDGNDSLEPYYQCLVCTNSKLCLKCHATRMQWNSDPKSKSITDPDFCCPYGRYMEVGNISSDSSDKETERMPTDSKQLTDYLEKIWKDAWEEIASGI